MSSLDATEALSAKGRTFAKEDAIRQLWPLMGFALRERLHRESATEVEA